MKIKNFFSKISLKIVFFIFVISFSINNASAVLEYSVSAKMSPSNPNPNDSVTITLNSYTNNLDGVLIVWTINGKTITSGIGKKNFSFKAPSLGGIVSVRALISLPEGNVEKNFTIRPNEMVLLWQANDSFVPPFYKGKALPILDSEIKVVAMPEIKDASGKMINMKNMTYDWKLDEDNQPESSGYGKNFFLYTSDYLEDSSSVSVEALSLDQNYSSSQRTTIGAFLPKIVFYRNKLETGTDWDNALKENYFVSNVETIEASPYFMSPQEPLHPYLEWSWYLNGSKIELPFLERNILPLRKNISSSGQENLRLLIEDSSKIFSNVERSINLGF